MKREFDAIIVGAGNGGLAAAAQLSSNGLNILCLEKHNIPGGFASSFVRGRFEFEASLHLIAEVGSLEKPAILRKIFEEFNLDIEWVKIPEAFHLIIEDSNINFTMPFGIENAISAIESVYPGSEIYTRRYLELSKEVSEAIGYIESKGEKLNKMYILRKFPNFIRTASYSVKQVLDALRIPQYIRNLFHGFWGYLAIPMDELNWGIWAMMVYSLLHRGAYIPKKRSTEISLALANRIIQSGGKLECNSKVTNIIVKEGKVWGVKTIHGELIKSKCIISNASPTIVYNYLIEPQSQVPSIAFRNVNSRSASCTGFVVYMGLNKNLNDLGLEFYSNMLLKSPSTSILHNSFNQLSLPDITISMCLNKVIPDASPDNTSILSITTFFDSNAWELLKPENYFQVKENVSKQIILNFEKMMNIPLTPYIEEVEVSTPITFSRYFDSYKGLIYGYGLNSWDHTISRTMRWKEEEYIQGLSFVGAHVMNQSFNSSYLSGIMKAKMIYNDLFEK